MANLYDPVIAGLPGPNMSDQFGYRGAPSSNPIGAIQGNQTFGVPLLAPSIAAQSTNPNVRATFTGTPEQQRANVARNANQANATLYPTNRGAKAFRNYVSAAYPDGKVPARLRELMQAAQRGGINDMGLAVAVSSDKQARKRAGTFDYGGRIGGLGGGAPLQAIQGDTYLESVLNAPVRLARAQDRAALGPTGPGMFAPLLAAASLFTPLSPVVPGLFSMYRGAAEQDPFQAVGGIGAVGAASGAFDGLWGDVKNAFGGGGFTNPAALDLAGAGTGANALGLTDTAQWSGIANVGGGFVNPSAIATPSAINEAIGYLPQSLGGASSGGDIADVLKAGKSLLPFLEEPEQAQVAGLLGGQRPANRTPYSPLQAPPPPDPLRYFRLETRAR